MLFAATESQQHILNNCCSCMPYVNKSVMVNAYTALLSVNHNFGE